MPDLRPFRGLRYAPQAGPPADLVAPPYDVIGPQEHAALCHKNPHNVVRLTLGERTTPEQAVADDWYGNAAAALRDWQDQGILQTDPQPAFYLYTQRFQHQGTPHARKLLLAALRLEPYGQGQVLPHEATMPGPKADRLRLMHATEANLSPILGFFPDPHAEANDLLDSLSQEPPDVSFSDPDGIGHELRLVIDPERQDAIRQLLDPLPFYIADGHHRYETALAYQQAHRPAASPQDEAPCDFILAACMSSADPGLVIRATHRMAAWEGHPTPGEMIEQAGAFFGVERLDADSPEDALRGLDSAPHTPAFVAYGGSKVGYARLTLTNDSILSQSPYPASSAARTLPATIFAHGFVLPAVPRDDSVAITYTADAHHSVERVNAGHARLAGLLPPVRVEELMHVVNAGERMPPKSTYFYPKPLTGIVLRILSARG
jgi:uncharacterized protein (DUF1015 family)